MVVKVVGVMEVGAVEDWVGEGWEEGGLAEGRVAEAVMEVVEQVAASEAVVAQVEEMVGGATVAGRWVEGDLALLAVKTVVAEQGVAPGVGKEEGKG